MLAEVGEDRSKRPPDAALEARIQAAVALDEDHSKQLLDVALEENIQALGIVVGEARSTDQQHYQLHKPWWEKQLAAADCDSRLSLPGILSRMDVYPSFHEQRQHPYHVLQSYYYGRRLWIQVQYHWERRAHP